jgi:hypothetical protein
MSAKPNIAAVPTALDKLRAAHRKRAELGAASTEIYAKIQRLAPLTAGVAAARAELQQVEEGDARALQGWIDRGASGSPPAADAAAREAAARKLASAEAQLKASAGVKGSLEDQLTAVNSELRDFHSVLRTVEIEVIGEETLRAVEMMRKTSIAVLESEAYYLALRNRLQQIRDEDNGGSYGGNLSPAVGVVFSQMLGRITDLNKLSGDERQQAAQAGQLKAQQTMQQILSGEDSTK